MDSAPSLLDVVALLADLPAEKLIRGQIGTVVELLNGQTALVEFCDEQGRTIAIAECRCSDLEVQWRAP